MQILIMTCNSKGLRLPRVWGFSNLSLEDEKGQNKKEREREERMNTRGQRERRSHTEGSEGSGNIGDGRGSGQLDQEGTSKGNDHRLLPQAKCGGRVNSSSPVVPQLPREWTTPQEAPVCNTNNLGLQEMILHLESP